MKNIYLLLLCFSIKVKACDICGGFMGITPYDNQSSISFQHRYRAFNGYRIYDQPSNLFLPGAYKTMHGGNSTINHNLNYSSKDYESYKAFELRGKYFIHKRLELNVFIPFNLIKSKEDSLSNSISGFGDPNLFAGFHVISKREPNKTKHKLILGAGCKLPIGNYYAKDNFGHRIDLLMQPGTGSFDIFGYANYVFGYRNFGFNLNSLYKRNGSNFYHERIGNSSSNYLNFFYKLKRKEFTAIPSVQLYYENCKGLYIQGSVQKGTSMINMLIGPGLEIFYKNVSINIVGQKCIYEKVEENQLKNAGRLVIGLTYNFNQINYLFKSKSKADQ